MLITVDLKEHSHYKKAKIVLIKEEGLLYKQLGN